MPKPNSKAELLEASQNNYKKLMELVISFSREDLEKDFPEGTLNRNVRDVLTHLHHWHLMFMDWYKVGMTGAKPDMPAKGFTWQTLPALNKKIWEKYRSTDLDSAMNMVDKSHTDIQKLIDQHSDEELFEKKRYKWTGSTSLGAYLIANASSHYNWAFKIIKKSMK